MVIRVEDLKRGDKLVIRNRERSRIVGTVTDVYRVYDDEPDSGIKNGRPGIEYTADTDGEPFWCYEDQIERRFA